MGCLLKASLSLRSLRKLGWGEWGALALGLVLNLYEPGRRLQAPQLWGSRLWLALPAFLCDERSQGVKGCGAQMLLPGHVEILLEKENDSKECGCPHTSQPWTQLTGQRRGLREGGPVSSVRARGPHRVSWELSGHRACAQLCLLWGLPRCSGNPLKLYAYVSLQIRKWSQKVRQPIPGCTPGMWPHWLLSADVWDQALTLNVKTTLSMGRLPVRRRRGEGCDCWGRWRRTDTLRVEGRLSEMGLLSKEVWLGCQVHFCA